MMLNAEVGCNDLTTKQHHHTEPHHYNHKQQSSHDSSTHFSMRPVTRSIQRTTQILSHLQHTMSASLPTPAAPWRSAFLSHVEKMDSPTFMLSTLHHNSSSVTPRSRTVVYRGNWAEIPVNPKNEAPLNPPLYESDLLTLTTDARMEKVPEFSTGGENIPQSGGGGPVEAVFWVVETKTQWRFRGRAYLLGQDIDDPSASHVKQEIEKHMRQKKEDGSSSWNWGKEITAHFGNLSPGMRGTFRNPPPGTKRDEKPAAGLGPGQKVEDLDDEIARKNFRVAVIVPDEVDQVDLSDPADGKRWNYRLSDGSWEKTELWP
jgi:pyridoxamine 5'-phosphate oxidase